jgi:hypothetical protein
MTSWLATGPPVMCWVAPARVCTSVPPERFCTMPAATNTIAPITATGSRIRTTIRTRSTQKLSSSVVRRRAKPRTSATATAMPTAADPKFCTASPAICTRWPIVDSAEYDCQLVLVTKLTAVFHAWSAWTAGNPSDSHRWFCSRWNAYRKRIDTAEKASTLRAYTPQDCSPSGLTPVAR